MTLADFLLTRRDLILQAAAKHGINKLRVFGSWARNAATPTSDLDLLVGVEKGGSYFDLIAFWQELEETLQQKVDMVSEGGLSPFLREKILREAVPL